MLRKISILDSVLLIYDYTPEENQRRDWSELYGNNWSSISYNSFSLYLFYNIDFYILFQIVQNMLKELLLCFRKKKTYFRLPVMLKRPRVKRRKRKSRQNMMMSMRWMKPWASKDSWMSFGCGGSRSFWSARTLKNRPMEQPSQAAVPILIMTEFLGVWTIWRQSKIRQVVNIILLMLLWSGTRQQ